MPESDYLRHRRSLMTGQKVKEEKPKAKPIAKKSDKRKIEDKEYKKIVKELLNESTECELKTPSCTKVAQGLHHQKRRGKNLLNKKYLLRS